MKSGALAKIFKALGDETRLEIVKMLTGKERCVCAFLSCFPMSQPLFPTICAYCAKPAS